MSLFLFYFFPKPESVNIDLYFYVGTKNKIQTNSALDRIHAKLVFVKVIRLSKLSSGVKCKALDKNAKRQRETTKM